MPTWGSQWFVSGMAELLSGRRAYVTGAADNTWVLSWGLAEWTGSLWETARSPQPTASALSGLRASTNCWDQGHKLVFCYPLNCLSRKHLYSSNGMHAFIMKVFPICTWGVRRIQQLTSEKLNSMIQRYNFHQRQTWLKMEIASHRCKKEDEDIDLLESV